MIQVRKARPEDAARILEVLNPFSRSGVLLDRSRDEITGSINKFFVAEDENGVIAGTVSYYDYGETLKEVRSLAVTADYQSRGTGSALVGALVKSLRKTSPRAKIFALTVAPQFFLKLGFSVVDKDTLPEKIWKDCVTCTKLEHCDETAVAMEDLEE
jgi:amino-acid N-acetyltransferase